jgi:hypothetical protein
MYHLMKVMMMMKKMKRNWGGETWKKKRKEKTKRNWKKSAEERPSLEQEVVKEKYITEQEMRTDFELYLGSKIHGNWPVQFKQYRLQKKVNSILHSSTSDGILSF